MGTLSVQLAGMMLGLGEDAVRGMCRKQQILCSQRGPGSPFRIDEASVLAFIERRVQAVMPYVRFTAADAGVPAEPYEDDATIDEISGVIDEEIGVVSLAKQRAKRGERTVQSKYESCYRYAVPTEKGLAVAQLDYLYPEGLSENSATPGLMEDKVEKQWLMRVPLTGALGRVYRQETGFRHKYAWVPINAPHDQSHQGCTSPEQAGEVWGGYLRYAADRFEQDGKEDTGS